MERYLRATTLEQLKALEGDRFDGVVFGAEFCPHLLPTLEEVKEARQRCSGEGIAFAVVIFLVREALFERVMEWLIAVHNIGEEYICNDWGVLTAALDRGVCPTPVAGRLLSRQRRGPRAAKMVEGVSDKEARALRGSLWEDPLMVKRALSMGVSRIELDVPLQGLSRPPLTEKISLSICGPYVPATIAISCPWRKEGSDPTSCPRPCRQYPEATIVNPENREKLHTHGNAQFIKVSKEAMVEWGEKVGATRMIWSEEIPG